LKNLNFKVTSDRSIISADKNYLLPEPVALGMLFCFSNRILWSTLMINANVLPIIAGILTACILCQWIAWRVKLPAIIFLLFTGIIAGPVLGLLNPENILGDLFFPFVSLSVAVILFEGSLALRFKEILGLEVVVRNMVSFGMAVTWLITALATHYAIGLSWEISFLFGAITVVTGPTVIAPMLRTIRPTQAVSNILRWEGIIIDPIGASLAVLVYEFIISSGGQTAWSHTMLTFAKIISVGTIIGICCGYFFGLSIRYHWLPEFLHNVTALTLVITTFIISNIIQTESGLVTVTIMGIWLANMKDVDLEGILDFKESISILLISLLFIMLAARLDIQSLKNLGWGVVFILIAIQFLARPLNVMVSTMRSKLTWPERHILAWIAPRGIIAAAISALFAVQLENAGFSDAHLLVPLTFSVIIVTVLLQSITARPIAQWLKVAEPEPAGFLIIGANLVARAIAKVLVQNNMNVLLVDPEWEKISKAKKEGLATYFGNPISEHADRHLDLIGIGRMLALSPSESVNISAVMHYRMELGRNNVFIIQSEPQESVSERLKMPIQRFGKTLFGKNLTYSSMAFALSNGGKIRTTTLTERFGFNDFIENHGQFSIPLFAIDPKGKVQIYSEGQRVDPKPKWLIVYLYTVKDDKKRVNN